MGHKKNEDLSNRMRNAFINKEISLWITVQITYFQAFKYYFILLRLKEIIESIVGTRL